MQLCLTETHLMYKDANMLTAKDVNSKVIDKGIEADTP